MAVSIAPLFIIIVSVIVGDIIWCADVTNSRQPVSSPWQLGNNKNAPLNTSQIVSGSKSTTPWPSLGQRRNQQQNNAQNSFQPTTNRQPMWVRPSNSPNWVRNTPPPIPSPAKPTNQNAGIIPNPTAGNKMGGSSQNFNTNFLNNEKGVNLNSNNMKGASNVNNGMRGVVSTGSRDVKPSNTARGGVGPQTVNVNSSPGMRGTIPVGSLNSGTETANEKQNQESNNQESDDVDDNELRQFSEELLTKDINNAAKYVTLNLQGMTTSRSSRDEAPLPLLSINQAAYSIPSIEKLMLLYNNYILETNQNEVYTAQEKIEENNLLDLILASSVMQHARNFLVKKGKIGKDPKEFKDLLRSIWFNMYSRGGGRIGSSGFEHVFLAELKNGQVSGLHNWVYFNEEEAKNRANYLGYMRKLDLGNKGAILKYHFNFHGVDKPVGSMFIGTSPELEIALYSTCFILRADRICPLKMGGNKFIVRTFTYRYRGKNMIGSAFPEI